MATQANSGKVFWMLERGDRGEDWRGSLLLPKKKGGVVGTVWGGWLWVILNL